MIADSPAPRAGRLIEVVVLATAALAMLPVLGVGWLRDDWLMLWAALDPATAPEGATGVFPRPVAFLVWRLSGWIWGDSSWPLHAFAGLCLLVVLHGLDRWMVRWGIERRSARSVAILAVGLHAALIEPRLWAAAGNGLLAAALGVWGAWFLQPCRPLSTAARAPRVVIGSVLMVLAVLARADAVGFLLWPLITGEPSASGPKPGSLLRTTIRWVAVGLAALGLLAWMLHAGGEWTFRPAQGGRLLRLMVLPWGPPLSQTVQSLVSLGGGLVLVLAPLKTRARAPRVGAASILAVVLAAAAVSWQPAGRYALLGVLGLAICLGWLWEGRRGARGLILRALVVIWLGAQLVSSWVGHTVRELRAVSAAEGSLYRELRSRQDDLGDRLHLVDPPPMGWRAGARDAENVVSAAMRRPIQVEIVRAESGSGALGGRSWVGVLPTLRWIDGHWVWEPGR
jgi:hypothetical protein